MSFMNSFLMVSPVYSEYREMSSCKTIQGIFKVISW